MKSTTKIDALALRAFTQSTKKSDPDTTLWDLLTQSEKIQIGRRILIAQAILAGKTRFEINNHLSVSPNTYTQIRRWLESEAAAYTSAHKIKQVVETRPKKYVEPLTFDDLKRRYPAHFLLFSLVDELFKIKK